MSEVGLAIFVLAGFVVPVPILAWLDRRPEATFPPSRR